ncbi:Spore cortex-lytic enzyme [Halioglobus japonicus]|nr:Spore cortex-lytic enzyme [Halioglobus japonicus]
MKTLRNGDKGADVERLQRKLEKKGFSPGDIDGVFGLGTDAAVRAFQASEGLLVDGVAGKRTLGALKFRAKVQPLEEFDLDAVSPALVSQLFPGAPIGNIKVNLPEIKVALTASDLDDKPMTLMALATIRAESAGFVPISEFRSRFNTSPNGHPFDLYDNRQNLGNTGKPDGERYKGRGFIQLTGRFNYAFFGKRIGLGNQLIDNPDLANSPEIAAQLLAAFLKEKELKIKQELLEGDLRAARRLVNGGSHGLDAFKECYQQGERLFGAVA